MFASRRPGVAALCAAFVATALGCASSSGGTPAIVEDGIYDFETRTGRRGDLRGNMTIAGQQLFIQPEQGSCRLDNLNPSIERVRFTCDNNSEVEELVITIDRRNPILRSSWSGVVTELRTRTVCDQYATQNGRRVCVATRVERYEVRNTVGGRLTFMRRTSD